MRKLSEQEFNKKYQMYKNMIYNIAYTYARNVADADDITQDVFMKYLNSNEVFQTLDNERFWLVRVSINTAKSFIKKAWKQRVSFDDELIGRMASNIEEKKSNEMFEIVCSLPPKYKEVIILYYYEDMKIDEISKTLKISISNVKKRLERGRIQIREKETKNGLF